VNREEASQAALVIQALQRQLLHFVLVVHQGAARAVVLLFGVEQIHERARAQLQILLLIQIAGFACAVDALGQHALALNVAVDCTRASSMALLASSSARAMAASAACRACSAAR